MNSTKIALVYWSSHVFLKRYSSVLLRKNRNMLRPGLLFYLKENIVGLNIYEELDTTVRQLISEHTGLHFGNPGRDPLWIHLPCRAPDCPRKAETWAQLVSGTSTDWMCLQKHYPSQSGSSLVRRTPCLQPPTNMEHHILALMKAWRRQSDTNSSVLSADEGGRYPPAWSFHLW